MLAAAVGSVDVLNYLKDVTELDAKDCDGRNLAHLAMLHYNDATCQLLEFLKVLFSCTARFSFYVPQGSLWCN